MTTAATKSPSEEVREIISTVKDLSHHKVPGTLRVKRARVVIEFEDGVIHDQAFEPDEQHEIFYTLYMKREVAKEGDRIVPTEQIDNEFGFYRRRK
jgi:hypothetical protein